MAAIPQWAQRIPGKSLGGTALSAGWGRAMGTMGLELEEGLRALSVRQLNVHGTLRALSSRRPLAQRAGPERSLMHRGCGDLGDQASRDGIPWASGLYLWQVRAWVFRGPDGCRGGDTVLSTFRT